MNYLNIYELKYWPIEKLPLDFLPEKLPLDILCVMPLQFENYCNRAEKVQNDEDLLSLQISADADNYLLIITKQTDCDIDQVTNFVKQYVPECLLITSTEAQIIYNLPDGERHKFDLLYTDIEMQKQNFKIISVKITNPATGEIYLR